MLLSWITSGQSHSRGILPRDHLSSISTEWKLGRGGSIYHFMEMCIALPKGQGVSHTSGLGGGGY